MALRAVKQRQYLFLLFAVFLVTGPNVGATGSAEEDRFFQVKKAETALVDDVFRLNASIDFHLSKEAKEALQSGVPLVLEIQIQVLRERPWIWNTVIAKLTQRYRVHYHALSQRYLVKNINTGVQSSFRTLDGVLLVIGTLKDFPMLDKHILESAQSYIGKLRADLDIEALPTPIRLWAYSSPKWRLGSEWYQWQLQP
ncbi:MAG: DUF4390 domain-containing protein [Gammaproteobacteria bacterium]